MPLLFIIVFAFMTAFALLLPSIMYFLTYAGASKALATQILASYSLAQFFVGPLLGRLSDRIGRKAVLIGALFGALMVYVGLTLGKSGLLFTFGCLALAGAASGAVAVAFAAVTDLTSDEDRAKGVGLLGAAIGLAFTVGPFVGAFLGGPDGQVNSLSSPAFAATLVLLLGLLAAIALPRSLGKSAERKAEIYSRLDGFRAMTSNKALLYLGIMMFVFTVALALMEPIIPYLIGDRYGWGRQEMGYLFAFAGSIVVLVQGGLVGRLTKRFGEARLLIAGIVMMGVGLTLMALAPASWFVVAGLGLSSAGGALFNTSNFALASKQAATEARGLVLGAMQSMQSLGRSGGPFVSGHLYQIAIVLPLLVGVAAMIGALALSRMLKSERQHQQVS